MSIKTSKPKTTAKNGNLSSNGKAVNGAAPKTAKPQKTMYEKWIEKYGVSDSEADRMMIETMKQYNKANKKSVA